jgi:hypothetical protein
MDEDERFCPGPLPGGQPDFDPALDLELAEYTAWLDRETAAGRDTGPGPWGPEDEDEPEDPADPAEAWEVWRPRFGQGDEADVLPPGPHLAGLTEEAVLDLGRLSDDELTGVLQATRRQVAREQYKQVLVTAGGPGDPARDGTARQHTPAPVPAQVNLIIPVGTLLGWSTAPAQAGPWGLLDADETRTVTDAAASHPLTRWCATLTGPDGTALAHACARGPHPHLLSGLPPQPPPEKLAGLLRRLNLAFTPVARGTCDHTQAEDHYTPSRQLRHLVRARTGTCDAPGCPAQALNADLDHTIPWPDGPTGQGNLAPRCRTHHRAKQAPDWQVDQMAPGVTRWTLPSGRTRTTTPTRYDT